MELDAWLCELDTIMTIGTMSYVGRASWLRWSHSNCHITLEGCLVAVRLSVGQSVSLEKYFGVEDAPQEPLITNRTRLNIARFASYLRILGDRSDASNVAELRSLQIAFPFAGGLLSDAVTRCYEPVWQ